jgi:hypothetical protein
MFIELFFLFLPLLIAMIIICLLWPNSLRSEFSIKGYLSIGLGLGISSCNFFIWMIAFGSPTKKIIVTEIFLLIPFFIILLFINRRWNGNTHYEQNSYLMMKQNHYRLLLICFTVVLIFALLSFIMYYINRPHGFWDAWAIWNMRARFLFRSGNQYINAFSSLYSWSHPDYPLLLPCNVARIWTYVGYESKFAPILIALLFTFSTVGLMVSSLSQMRSPSQGLLAGMFLLGFSSFVDTGANQGADTPIGYYFLATIILFCLYDQKIKKRLHFVLLAGAMSGFASWTKNEGLLFIIAIIAARFVVIFPTDSFRSYIKEMIVFLAGVLPIMLIIIYFKTQLAPTNDLISGQSFKATLSRLSDFHRYFIVGKFYLNNFYEIFKGRIIFFLLYIIFCGFSSNKQFRKGVNTSLFVLFFQLLGYFIVYIITPHEIKWHLNASLNRLFIQLLPSAIFIFFLVGATLEEVVAEKSNLFSSTYVK